MKEFDSFYPIVEVIIQAQNVILVRRIMPVDIFQKLDFIKALIKKIFIVLYDFHTYIHSGVQVMCLNSFAEGS